MAATEAFCDFETTEMALYNSSGSFTVFAGATLSTATAMTSPAVFAAQFNSTSSKLFKNAPGNALITGNAGTGNGSGGVRIGALTGGADPLNGKIAEVIMYSHVLTSDEMLSVFNYLGNRYGITIL